jgi:hypothetical protein
MPRVTVRAGGEAAAVDYEPFGAGLTSISKLGTGTLNKRMDMLPAGNGITLPPGVVSDPDMAYPPVYPVYGYFLAKPTSVLGSGQDVSVLQVKPSSLTQSYQKIDAITEPNPNPYRVVRFDRAALVQDLTIRGTFQGTSSKTGKVYGYHGVQFYETVNPTIRRVRISDIAGTGGVPPWETFSLEAYRCTGTFLVEDVLIDAPTLPCSAGVTVNATPSPLAVVMRRVKVLGHTYGGAWTTFNTQLSRFLAEDWTVDGCVAGFNFEQVNVGGGSKVNNAEGAGIVIRRPDIRRVSFSHLTIDASVNGGVSNRVDIYDPVGITPSNPFGVVISATYGYANVPPGPNVQRGADIHLWMQGVERPDLIRWIRTKGAP